MVLHCSKTSFFTSREITLKVDNPLNAQTLLKANRIRHSLPIITNVKSAVLNKSVKVEVESARKFDDTP